MSSITIQPEVLPAVAQYWLKRLKPHIPFTPEQEEVFVRELSRELKENIEPTLEFQALFGTASMGGQLAVVGNLSPYNAELIVALKKSSVKYKKLESLLGKDGDYTSIHADGFYSPVTGEGTRKPFLWIE